MFGLPEDEVDGTTVAGIAEVVKAAMCDAVAARRGHKKGSDVSDNATVSLQSSAGRSSG